MNDAPFASLLPLWPPSQADAAPAAAGTSVPATSVQAARRRIRPSSITPPFASGRLSVHEVYDRLLEYQPQALHPDYLGSPELFAVAVESGGKRIFVPCGD